MKIVGVIGSALHPGHDVIHVHDPEREVRLAPDAYAFLFAVQAVPVRPVVREFAKVRALGWAVRDRHPPPHSALPGYPFVHQFDRQRRKVDSSPSALQSIRRDKRRGAAAERVQNHIALIGTGGDDPVQKGERLLGWIAKPFGMGCGKHGYFPPIPRINERICTLAVAIILDLAALPAAGLAV